MSEWLDILRASPSFASRLVPSSASTTLDEIGAGDIGEFLLRLNEADRKLVVDGLDLVAGDYGPFLEGPLKQLLLSLRSRRTSELAEVGPALSGQPVWGRTVLGWAAGTLPRHRFVSRRIVNTWDAPENQALKLLLRNLAYVSGGIVSLLGRRCHPRARAVAAHASTALKDPIIQAIPDAPPSEQIVSAAEGSRDLSFQAVGHLLRRRLALTVTDDVSRWRRSAFAAALSPTAFVPIEPEAIFELLALARVLDALEHDLELGPPISHWMRIGTNARVGPIARFVDGSSGSIEVYFNRSPAFLLDRVTPYTGVFRKHDGIGQGADRRPDITIVRTASDGTRSILFVEVKLPSVEGGSYVRDSIYKAFGYLYDFSGLWASSQNPKVALYLPTDLGPRFGTEGPPSELALVSPLRHRDLVWCIASALDLESLLMLLPKSEVA